jgi:hypothetical protein
VITELDINEINLARGTQIRATISEAAIQKYASLMETENGRNKFEPIIIFRDTDGELWIADGHHRVMAAIRLKLSTIHADIRAGSKADAIWEAARANSRNGVPLEKADIRKAIGMILAEMPDRSERMIAEVVGCAPSYVNKIKNQLLTCEHLNDPNTKPRETITGKDGKKYPARPIKSVSTKSKKMKAPPLPPVSAVSVPTDKHELSIQEELFSKTQPPEKKTNVSVDKRQAEWKQKEIDIFEIITKLMETINEWFDVAPSEYHDSFAERVRKRLNEILGNESYF